MLHLTSKFIHSQIIDCSRNAQNYKEISDVYCSAFALISPGDKFDSVNYSKIKVCHERTVEGGLNIKLKFVITRELKLKQHFVMIAGKVLEGEKMLLIGNAKVEHDNNTSSQLTAFVVFSTHQL